MEKLKCLWLLVLHTQICKILTGHKQTENNLNNTGTRKTLHLHLHLPKSKLKLVV